MYYAPRSVSMQKNWLWAFIAVVTVGSVGWTHYHLHTRSTHHVVPVNAHQIIQECIALNVPPGPPPGFASRSESDRYEPGMPATLIQNATIWTGGDDGHEVIVGEIFLDKGIIKAVGENIADQLSLGDDILRINAGLAWVTPGINDLHSHLGVNSRPALQGSHDTNSHLGITQPW